MGAFKWVKGAIDALTAPAEDPRQQYADVRETHLLSLERLRTARTEVEAALDRMNALTDKAQRSFTALETDAAGHGGSDRFAAELKRDLSDELKALNRHTDSLRQQQEHLVLTEQRLVSSLRRGAVTREMEGASDTSRQARDLARSTLSQSPELRGLDRAIDTARRATERLQDRAVTIDKMASLGVRLGSERQGNGSRDLRLVDRYVIALEDSTDDLRRDTAEGGLNVLKNLMYEHEQLRDAITERGTAKGVGSARIEILGAQTYKRALDALENALGIIDGTTSVEFPNYSGTVLTRADELIATAVQSEGRIRAAREEINGEDPEDPGSGILGAEARLKETRGDPRSS